MTSVILVAISLVSGAAVPTTILVVLLGLFGLGANPVLIALAVRYADHAPTLGSSLAVAAFNFGTAVSSWVGALALQPSLGPVGPVVVGAGISALTLIPIVALARQRRWVAPPSSVEGTAAEAAVPWAAPCATPLTAAT
ncbi:hypothetical protein [Nocardioides koreensis]|uniref:hypothetical protein n=1 Tax=Nocardioides koreensis TaxID=433651 RepID=UPI0031DAA904